MDATQVLLTLVTSSLMAAIVTAILQNRQAKQIEVYKADLQAIAFEHETRFSKLHEKQAEVVDETYKRLVRTQRSVETLTDHMEFPSEPSKQEKAEAAAEAGRAFVQYFDENRLYIPEPLCAKINVIINNMRKILLNFKYMVIDAEPKSREKTKVWGESWKAATTEVPELRVEIEQEFRNLLGQKNN